MEYKTTLDVEGELNDIRRRLDALEAIHQDNEREYTAIEIIQTDTPDPISITDLSREVMEITDSLLALGVFR